MKIYKWIALTALFSLSALSAVDGDHPDANMDDEDVKPAAPAHREQMDVHGKKDTEDRWDVYTYAAFTYWQATVPPNIVSPISRSATHLNAATWKRYTRPGFLVGLGFLIPESMVDVNAQYTWFYNKQDKGKFTSTTLTAPSTFLTDYRTTGGAFANTFNRVDLMFNKSLFFGKSFSFVPGAGFVGNWADLYFDKTSSDSTAGDGDQTVAIHNDVWGVGPYFHGKANFICPRAMSSDWFEFVLATKWGIGWCWQQSKITSSNVFVNGAASSFREKYTENWLTNLLDGSIGFRWQMTGEDYKFALFCVEVNWTVQTWNDYAMLPSTTTTHPYVMQGLTAGLGASF